MNLWRQVLLSVDCSQMDGASQEYLRIHVMKEKEKYRLKLNIVRNRRCRLCFGKGGDSAGLEDGLIPDSSGCKDWGVVQGRGYCPILE